MYQLNVTIRKNKNNKNCLCIYLVNRHQPFTTQTVKAVSTNEPLFLFENKDYLVNRISVYSEPRHHFSQSTLQTHTPYFICLLENSDSDEDSVPSRYFKDIQEEIVSIRQLLVVNGIALHEHNIIRINFSSRPTRRLCCF